MQPEEFEFVFYCPYCLVCWFIFNHNNDNPCSVKNIISHKFSRLKWTECGRVRERYMVQRNSAPWKYIYHILLTWANILKYEWQKCNNNLCSYLCLVSVSFVQHTRKCMPNPMQISYFFTIKQRTQRNIYFVFFSRYDFAKNEFSKKEHNSFKMKPFSNTDSSCVEWKK